MTSRSKKALFKFPFIPVSFSLASFACDPKYTNESPHFSPVYLAQLTNLIAAKLIGITSNGRDIRMVEFMTKVGRQ